jgi:hypothetical protein
MSVAVVDVYWRSAPRLAFKIPDAPAALGLQSPYPGLREDWNAEEHEWGWGAITADRIPPVRVAFDMVRSYHPATGPMIKPTDGASA